MSPSVQTVVLDVEGMKCGGCVRAVETTLLDQPGVQRADVNLVSRSAWLDLTAGESDVDGAVYLMWRCRYVLMGYTNVPHP